MPQVFWKTRPSSRIRRLSNQTTWLTSSKNDRMTPSRTSFARPTLTLTSIEWLQTSMNFNHYYRHCFRIGSASRSGRPGKRSAIVTRRSDRQAKAGLMSILLEGLGTTFTPTRLQERRSAFRRHLSTMWNQKTIKRCVLRKPRPLTPIWLHWPESIYMTLKTAVAAPTTTPANMSRLTKN